MIENPTMFVRNVKNANISLNGFEICCIVLVFYFFFILDVSDWQCFHGLPDPGPATLAAAAGVTWPSSHLSPLLLSST